ncbi:MAG: hypothetical protein WC869_01810 [Phycisphaerae bacterium]|jgi:flagellar biosynthesis chaperone FliJ
MKRFAWPLQRLLDVKIQKEQALRGELARLQQELAFVGGEIDRRLAALEKLARDLDGQELQDRLPRQQIFLRQLPVEQAVIDTLRAHGQALEAARAEKMAQLLKERMSRKTLEQLREKRLLQYQKELNAVEQKHLDEVAQGMHQRKGVPAGSKGPSGAVEARLPSPAGCGLGTREVVS